MKKKVIFISTIIFLIAIIIFFIKVDYKKIKISDNQSNKNVNQIKEYILNISSYIAELEVTINSNKNTNKYILKQEYIQNQINKQTILKPENIEGIEICYKNGNLEINNSKLNLSKIYNNYPYLSDNVLWLSSFIDKCKQNPSNVQIYEENEFIVMELDKITNTYMTSQKLYLENGTGKPKKMIIQDNTKKNIICIIYTEINLNN